MNDILRLDTLIEWLEKQNKNEVYVYGDIHNCLLCQYFKSMGLDIESVGGAEYSIHGDPKEYPIPYELNEVALPARHRNATSTFGYALKRAYKLAEKQNGNNTVDGQT